MITNDELLLYYYRDGLDAAERARIGAAISNDPELARRMHGLVARLDAAAARRLANYSLVLGGYPVLVGLALLAIHGQLHAI